MFSCLYQLRSVLPRREWPRSKIAMIYALNGLYSFLLRKWVAALVCVPGRRPSALGFLADGGRSQATGFVPAGTYATLSFWRVCVADNMISFIFFTQSKVYGTYYKSLKIFQVAWNLHVATLHKKLCRLIPINYTVLNSSRLSRVPFQSNPTFRRLSKLGQC